VFLTGLLAVVFLALVAVVYSWQDPLWKPTDSPAVASTIGLLAAPQNSSPLLAASALFPGRVQTLDALDSDTYWSTLDHMHILALLGSAFGFLLLAGVVAWRIDVNVFSLEATCANRLVRCYLGASRKKKDTGHWPRGAPTKSELPSREPNPITGFDPNDDLLLADLAIGVKPKPKAPTNQRTYWGPYHIVNTALNLVEGQELAWRERKAPSFILTPRFCGSLSTDFRPSTAADNHTGYGDNLSLGTAVAVSGAAVSPNMGYHSSPAVGALLTIFNVRIGAWFGNPYSDRWPDSGPRWALFHLLRELTGHTHARSKYVYLSDGGHFDNLGIYELVNRRCRYVIACDAGCDPNFEFADLGNVIRKCRTDFGVRIEIDVAQLRPLKSTGYSQWHCALGIIRYDDIDPEAIPGTLVHLKSSLTGDEPSDLQNYVVEHPDFPHQSTADQFFTESQFESYRALGYHMAQEVFGPAMACIEDDGSMTEDSHKRVARQLFSELDRHWFTRPPDLHKSFLESTKDFITVQKDLRIDEHLRGFSRDLYDGRPGAPPPNPVPSAQDRAQPAAQATSQEHAEITTADALSPTPMPTTENAGKQAPQAPPLERSEIATERAREPRLRTTPAPLAQQSAELLMVSQMLQVMENTWLELQLNRYHAHPLLVGWMNVFRRWVNAPLFRRCWPDLRGEYSRGFVRFAEQQLRMDGPAVEVSRLDRNGSEYHRQAVRILVQEFSLEWPANSARLENLPHDTWLISLKSVESSPFPCGLFLVAPTQPAVKDVTPFEPEVVNFDFFMWLRGPYRGLGIGRRALAVHNQPDTPFPFDKIWEKLREQCAPKPFCLNVRLPTSQADGEGGRMQRAMWLRFFYDYGFRRRPTRPGTTDQLVLRRMSLREGQKGEPSGTTPVLCPQES
jgi:hypothetical protein